MYTHTVKIHCFAACHSHFHMTNAFDLFELLTILFYICYVDNNMSTRASVNSHARTLTLYIFDVCCTHIASESNNNRNSHAAAADAHASCHRHLLQTPVMTVIHLARPGQARPGQTAHQVCCVLAVACTQGCRNGHGGMARAPRTLHILRLRAR